MGRLPAQIKDLFDKKMLETSITFFLNTLSDFVGYAFHDIHSTGKMIIIELKTANHREAKIDFSNPLDPILIVNFPEVVHLRTAFGNITRDDLIEIIKKAAH